MRKIKFDKNLISGILTLTFVLLLVFVDISDYFPNFYNYIPLIWIVSIIYDIYKTRKYLKNIPDSEIRIRNKNNSYYDLLPFIMGSILCAISFLFFFISDIDKIPFSLLFVLGLVSILQGLNSIPSAFIKYEDGILNFENEKIKLKIEVHKIKDFEINDNEMLLFDEEGNRMAFRYLELNQSEIEKTVKFLKKYIN
ncbi:MAG: hypothetical protein Q8K02_15865 [Flavobacterium sp.]|nr:hypothetical protein [Flavobacterium sp.]